MGDATTRSECLFFFRLNGRIIFGGTYFCELVNIHYSKIAGLSFFDFVFPDDLAEAKQFLQHHRFPKADSFRLRLKRADGTPVWVDIQFAAMKWPDGEVYALSAEVTAKVQVA